jgi:hypothetical protein
LACIASGDSLLFCIVAVPSGSFWRRDLFASCICPLGLIGRWTCPKETMCHDKKKPKLWVSAHFVLLFEPFEGLRNIKVE